ncbi:hypothetical protein BH10CYA1_BH10CYA1_07770 [soil metagenome]
MPNDNAYLENIKQPEGSITQLAREVYAAWDDFTGYSGQIRQLKKENAVDTESDKKFLPDMSIQGEGGDNIIAKKKDAAADIILQKESYSD